MNPPPPRGPLAPPRLASLPSRPPGCAPAIDGDGDETGSHATRLHASPAGHDALAELFHPPIPW